MLIWSLSLSCPFFCELFYFVGIRELLKRNLITPVVSSGTYCVYTKSAAAAAAQEKAKAEKAAAAAKAPATKGKKAAASEE